jgi:hypothetical protein
MRYNESAEAKCPFYRKEVTGKAFKVYCEGVDRTSSINLNFPTSKAFREYTAEHCDRNYCKCLVYNMLCNKYKD